MKYLLFGRIRFKLHEVFSFRAISLVSHHVLEIRKYNFSLHGLFSYWAISCVLHEVLHTPAMSSYRTSGIFTSTCFICLTWSAYYSVHFILAYMKYLLLEQFHFCYIKYFPYWPFDLSLYEVYSYRATTIVLNQLLPINAISFNPEWGIFISSHLICLTSSTSRT